MPSRSQNVSLPVMQELAQRFPADLKDLTVYDMTVFVTSSIEEVIKTLLEAFVLVALVVFVFLESYAQHLFR